MPAKPIWYRKLPHIIEELRRHPLTYVDRATVEFLLGVSRRRAQQIMAPCILERRAGVNGLADRDALIARLERIAEGDATSMRHNVPGGWVWPRSCCHSSMALRWSGAHVAGSRTGSRVIWHLPERRRSGRRETS